MRIVYKILAVLGMAILVLSAIRCDKDREEEDLKISIDAAAVEISPAATFDFNFTVLSEMPEAGVAIEYIIKGEADNQVYYQRKTFTRTAKTRLTIHVLPRQVMCICTITAVSRGNANNVATTSFRIGYK